MRAGSSAGFWKRTPGICDCDVVARGVNALSRPANAVAAAGETWTRGDCAHGVVAAVSSSRALPSHARKLDDANTKLGIADSRGRRCFRQQTRFSHSGNRVCFQDEGLARVGHKTIDARVNFQPKGAKCLKCQLLNFLCQRAVNLRRTNMLCTRASLRIQ